MKNRLSWTRGVAAMGAAVLAFIGIAPAAMADDPLHTDVTASVASETLTVSVSGQGYDDLPDSSIGAPAAGVYAALRDPDTMSNDAINADNDIVPDVQYVPSIKDGEWSVDLSASASDLDPDADYEVIVWVAHGAITDESLVDTVSVSLTDDQHGDLFGVDKVERTATASVTSVDAGGAEITVNGKGFTDLPDASTGASAAGVYAGLRDADTMSLEQIAEDTSILPAVEYIWDGNISDGQFSTTLEAGVDKLDRDANYEVIVWVAHGNPTNDTLLETLSITFTDDELDTLFPPEVEDPEKEDPKGEDPEEEEPEEGATFTLSSGVTSDGLELAVAGEGFTDLPRASTGAPAAGVYAALRDPSSMSDSAINADTGIVPAVAFIPSSAIKNGEWKTTLTAAKSDLKKGADYEVIVWVAHGDITGDTLLGSEPVELTKAELEKLFADSGDEKPAEKPSDKPTEKPAEKPSEKPQAPKEKPAQTDPSSEVVCTTRTVPGSAGSPQLSWGVKSSFVSYIQGGIAKGNFSTSNGAARSGGSFTWGSGTGSLNESGHGTLRFPGSVHFSGHDGILNTTISNVRVQVTSGNSGVLIADMKSQNMEGKDVSGYGIAVANLQFLNVGKTGGSASATLTSAGARALADFYSAGEAMDSVQISFAGATGETTEEVCLDADGNRVNPDGSTYSGDGLATTGATSAPVGMAALSAILLGAMLLTARRFQAAR